MQEYLHHLYNSKRLRNEVVSLNPPLKLISTQEKIVDFPKICNGELILLYDDGTIRIFDEATFELKWEHMLKYGRQKVSKKYFKIFLQSYIIGDALIIRLDNVIHRFDLKTREMKFSRDLDNGVHFKSDLFINEDTIFYTKDDTKNTMLNIQNNKILWQRDADWSPLFSLRIDDKLFITDGEENANLLCININNGNIIWKKDISDIGIYTNFLGSEDGGIVCDNPCIYKNQIIIPIEAYHLVAFDVDNGNELWRVKVDSINTQTYTIDPKQNLLYCVGWEHLCIINPDNGKIEKSISITDEISNAGIMTQGYNYLSLTDKYLYIIKNEPNLLFAMNKVSGKIEWTYELNDWSPYWNFPLIINKRLYLLTDNGTLNIFEEDNT